MSIQITIDGQLLDVDPGVTILNAARQHGMDIPTLCDYPGLPAHGSCRMCIVEIQGRSSTPTACTTPAEAGMVIQTNSPRIQALRGELLQMLLADHPASCLSCLEESHCDECMVTLHKAGVTTGCRSCPKDGQCQLQDLVQKIGLPALGYPPRYRMLKVEKNDPFFDRDYNLCILCGRCVRQCEKLHFTCSIAYTRRGTHTVVGTAFNRTHLDAGCVFCGACVEVCPTGALSEKTRKWDGEADGETATTCPLCSLGCQVRLLTKNGRVIGSLPDHQAGAESLCVKGRFGFPELLNHPTRLTQPQKAVEGNQRLNIAREETIRLAAEKLSGIATEGFEMVVSPNLSLESLYIAQKFTRQGMKSPHIYTNRPNGYTQDAGAFFNLVSQSQPLSILAEASTILCLGFDNIYSQSVVEVMLHQAKVNGARIIAALCPTGNLGRFADLWLKSEEGNKTAVLVEQAARWLHASPSTSTVILAGPAIFSHPERAELLSAINSLVQSSQARLIVIADQAELINVLMGFSGRDNRPSTSVRQALYLLGENIEELPAGEKPFVLYQNIYPPEEGLNPDLILPTTPFSEEDGSLIDYAGQVKTLHRAVPPPGEALPAWEILCRIARKMGLPGFDFTSVADIQAEMASLPEHFLANGQVDWASVSPPTPVGTERWASAAPQPSPDTYLGFPLTRYIQGLNQVAPAKGRNSNG
jgi:NADH dehydrogenase/NADH:ubiquinone oxidoreductase subunit G